MPYRNRTGKIQSARSIGHVPIIQNEMVKERLQSFRVYTPDPVSEIDSNLIVTADTLDAPGEPIRWLMAFDGSPNEVAANEEYPSTRIGFIQVAAVLIHLKEMLSQQEANLVDPKVLRDSTQQALHSIVMPGSNVCRQDMPSVMHSWRAEIHEILREYSVEGVPLFNTYKLLVELSDKITSNGGIELARCSELDNCKQRNIDVPFDGAECPGCGAPLFPTDAFRIHEEVLEEHPNVTALGRLMLVLEQITLVSYLNFLLQRQPRVLSFVGFIIDGPLALFGPPAWLHTPILSFLWAMQDNLSIQNLRNPVIVGIEKSGQFAEHAKAISGRIPRRCLMLLPDAYIYQHILTFRSPPNVAYGRDTYYGQKFYYKTGQGQLLTITVPKTKQSVTDPYNPHHYPTLPDTLALLDRIGTALYDDAVIPVALAHSYASIPLRTGSRVLTLLSRELLGLDSR